MSKIFGLCVYVAVGLLFYMLFYSPDLIVWADPWVYIIVLTWPFVLIWNFFLIIVGIAALAIVIAMFYIVCDHYLEKW